MIALLEMLKKNSSVHVLCIVAIAFISTMNKTFYNHNYFAIEIFSCKVTSILCRLYGTSFNVLGQRAFFLKPDTR